MKKISTIYTRIDMSSQRSLEGCTSFVRVYFRKIIHARKKPTSSAIHRLAVILLINPACGKERGRGGHRQKVDASWRIRQHESMATTAAGCGWKIKLLELLILQQ